MTIKEVLQNKIFSFPIESSEYFPKHIEETLGQFRFLLDSVKDEEYAKIIKKQKLSIEETSREIIDITNGMFKGTTGNAYTIFEKMMDRFRNLLLPKSDNLPHEFSNLFKARQGTGRQLTRSEMFHVPFKSRYNINSSRFSLPGVPCLYLANSIYTCWEEFDRPPFNEMSVSRFEI